MSVLSNTYSSVSTIACSVASLASTTDALKVGWQSGLIDNSFTKYPAAILSGKVTATGTTGNINVFVWGQYDDTPTYPDGLSSADSTFTPSDPNGCYGYMKLVWSTSVDAAKTYVFTGIPVEMAFGGSLPQRWGVFVYHTSGAILNATASNHQFRFQGLQPTVT